MTQRTSNLTETRQPVLRATRAFVALALVLVVAACSQQPLLPAEAGEVGLLSDADIEAATLGLPGSEVFLEDVDLLERDAVAEAVERDASFERELGDQATLSGAAGWLVWVQDNPNARARYRIYAQDQAGGSRLLIYRGRRAIDSVAVSGDGDALVMAMRQGVESASDFEIYAFVRSTGTLTRLTRNTVDDTNVSLSASGGTIVYESEVRASGMRAVTFLDSGVRTQLRSRLHHLVEPSVSGDGNVVAFVQRRSASAMRVRLFDRASAGITNVTRWRGAMAHPSPSDGGRFVAWLVPASPNRVIVHDLTAGTNTIVARARRLAHPHLTADGAYLTYGMLDATGNYDVFTKDLARGGVARTSRTLPPLEQLAAYWQQPVDSGPGQRPEAPEVIVDTAIEVPARSLPGFEDGTVRPVAAVTDAKGNQAEFIENELLLMTDRAEELEAFLARWDGELLLEFDPADYDLQGLGGIEPFYLVRITTDLADTGTLGEDLRRLDPESRGLHRVSSEAGLGLLAAAANEAAAGLNIGVNWVGRGAAYGDRSITEAPSGPGGASYDRNTFTWNHLRSGSTQDIGVTEAWRALALAGLLGNKVKIAILDMGFGPNSDFPTGGVALSNIPFRSALNTSNLIGCGSGNPCPWHGTNVLHAAMAVPGNNFGSAGPAGPVGVPVVVSTLYDFATGIVAVARARSNGARVINMSYGARVPATLSFTVLPFNVATLAVRASGALLFASAGNDGDNVDDTDCFIVCWEEAWHTPCENGGVICVGGLGTNSTVRASGSNYGPEEVDLYAPYTVWVGPDPANTGNTARSVSGTSFSSPYAAGVAALVWAANPSLRRSQVESILFDTANWGRDGTSANRSVRYVDAYEAVIRALGNDEPPELTITSPAAGSIWGPGISIHFSASATDPEDGTPQVSWSSNIDGTLGTGTFLSTTLSIGTHTVTATAKDSGGYTLTDTVSVTVANNPPNVWITKPLPGDTVYRGQAINLRGASSDADEPGGRLPCGSLRWTSSVSGDPLPRNGCDVSVAFASNGTRTLTLTGTDSDGGQGTATVTITVQEPPSDLPPTVTITSPSNAAIVSPDTSLSLSGTATDPEGASPLVYEWFAHRTGDTFGIRIGTGSSLSWKPSDTYTFGSCAVSDTIALTLYVRDPSGNVGRDMIGLVVLRIC